MEQPADTFAAFLTVLATALDDAAVTGAELARRVHLSRYHFDRVIAATAGEAPGRFRRRVLLERAAHRLGTSGATILEVAVEAGYSSHEAFTRAFTRAYGRSPSQWRRSPGPVPLAAPSHVHFHPPGSLRLPATRKVTSGPRGHDGRAPHLARRADARPGGVVARRTSRRGDPDLRRGHRLRADPALAAGPPRRADGDVERRDRR